MTIRRLRIRTVSIPVDPPIETAAGAIAASPTVLLDVETSDGVTGCAYVSVYTPVALRPLAGLLQELEPLLAGRAATPADARATLRRELRLLGLGGLAGLAIAAVDTALWDAQAKAEQQPLAVLLGGSVRPIPAYAVLRSRAPGALDAEITGALDAGVRAFKIKAGRGDDVCGAVRTVRHAAGDEAEILVDFNGSLTVEEAIARAHDLADEHVGWIEEPTRITDVAGHARIAGASPVPVCLGENWEHPDEVTTFAAAGATAHAMLDALRIGGVTGWRDAAARAGEAGLPVSSHAYVELSAHLLAATPGARWLEHNDKTAPILRHPAALAGGHVVPGPGIAWDEAAVERYRA